jgi:hypothetical protein
MHDTRSFFRVCQNIGFLEGFGRLVIGQERRKRREEGVSFETYQAFSESFSEAWSFGC